MNKNIIQSGFTFIETLIYLGLFSIIIGGALVTTYSIISSTSRTEKNIIIQEEANFLLRKIDWALSGVTSIPEPSLGNSGETLCVFKINFVNNPVKFSVSDGKMYIQSGGGSCSGVGPAFQLNSDNVRVAGVDFLHFAPIGNKPGGIQANFSLSEPLREFQTIKYFRQ